MSKFGQITSAVLCFFLAGCREVPYSDSTQEERFSKLAKREFVTLEKMYHCGIRRELRGDSEVEEYLLEFTPGCTGPEVAQNKEIAAGLKFRVVKVLTCPNCKPWHRNDTVFLIESGGLNSGHSTPTYLMSIVREVWLESETGYVELNPEYFDITID